MQCSYIFVRGSKTGTQCDRFTTRGKEHCSVHTSQVKKSKKKAKEKRVKTKKKSKKKDKKSKKKEKREREDCSICLSKVKGKNSCILKCGHEFHLDCIFDLYNQQSGYRNKCPNCRKIFHKLPARVVVPVVARERRNRWQPVQLQQPWVNPYMFQGGGVDITFQQQMEQINLLLNDR